MDTALSAARMEAEDTHKAPAAMTAREALGATPFLAAVPAATLDALADRAMLHLMPAGSMLFEQAETPAFAHLLIAGSVELLSVRGELEMLVELVEPFDLLLPAAVFSRQPYLLRARVLAEARLVLIQADAFRQAVAGDHALCLSMLACQGAQFRRQVRQAKNLRLRSAEERVGTYLKNLLHDGQSALLPLEKRHIASQLGMTRETFSRALAAVARHGIRVDGEIVSLPDADAARERFPLDPLIDGREAIQPLPLFRRHLDSMPATP